MSLVGPAIISGLILAGLYGLLASGIVIVYNTSRVINFAQGAVAMFSVFCLKFLLDRHVPYLLAMLVAIAIGAGIGYAIARLTMIPMRNSSALNRTIVTIGWLIVLQALADLAFSANQSTNFPSLLSQDRLFSVLGLGVTSQEVAIFVAAIAVAVLLSLFFMKTFLGIAMRATAQNPEALELLGTSTNSVNSLAWIIAGALAALGGILVSPQLGALDDTTLTLFVIQSFAAALVGGMRNLPRTAAGALVLAMIQSFVSILPVSASIPGLKFSVAFAFIVVVLVLRPDLAKQALDRGAAAGRRVALRTRSMSTARWIATGVVAVFLLLEGLMGAGTGGGVFSDYNRFLWSEVFADAVIFLSLVLLVGFVGQISLCQVTFAGFGAFFAAIFVTDWNLPFIVALPLAALATAPIGMLVGIPALRIRGLQLAVVTLSFALVGDQLFFAQSFPLSGGPAGRPITGVFGPLNLLQDFTNRQMYWVFLIVFAVLGFTVVLLQRSPSGRSFAAVRDSEVAASSVGVSVVRMKLTGFAISAAMAGLGGGMYALTVGTVSSPSFNPEFSIQFLALALLAGIRSVWGALVAAVLFIWGPIVIGSALGVLHLSPGAAGYVELLLSGALLIVTMRFNPRGIVGGVEDAAGLVLGHSTAVLGKARHLTGPRPTEAA